MSLRDQAIAVLRQHGASYHFMNVDEAADAILALVKAHLTSDEAVERARRQLSFHPSVRASILAALGDTHD